ncbi:MAG: hypothetical protein IPI73_00335 [Betaproteobacteria bacterium]|nr:hypothetical protein [Betaproteobacteria bacterium]
MDPRSYFALKRQGDSGWEASADLSPLTIDGSAIRPWALPVVGDATNVNGELGGSSTRRHDPLPNGVNNPNQLRLAKSTGLSTGIADGFFIQVPADAGTASPAEWKYGTTAKYRNWQGEWWTAMFVNGTFLHVRNSVEIAGYAQVGGVVQKDGGLIIQDGTYTDGYSYCKGWARFQSQAPGVLPERDAGKVDGQCLLLSKDFDHAALRVGDLIEIGGQRRTITAKVTCEGPRLDNTGPLIDLFMGQLYCDENDPGDSYPIDPETSNWNRTAIVVDPPVASLVGDAASDWFAIRRFADIDTCARATTGIASFFCGIPFLPDNYDPTISAIAPVSADRSTPTPDCSATSTRRKSSTTAYGPVASRGSLAT